MYVPLRKSSSGEHRVALVPLEDDERGERRQRRATNAPTIRGEVQPYVFASMSP